MTTNQTIDGVPRELLLDIEYWLKHMEAEKGVEGRCMALKELRALLDAPGIEVHDKYGVQMVDCPECSHQWGPFFECGNRPAQGEPVAWLIQCQYSGLVEQAEPNDKSDRPEEWSDSFPVYRRYSEQPAPVAVVLPERLDGLGDPAGDPHGHYEDGWDACLDEVKRLNK